MPFTSENGASHATLQSESDMPGTRPPHVTPPKHLSKSPPIPEPARSEPAEEHGGAKDKDPTRYGDWQREGKCVDF
jgi:hypothetical protein